MPRTWRTKWTTCSGRERPLRYPWMTMRWKQWYIQKRAGCRTALRTTPSVAPWFCYSNKIIGQAAGGVNSRVGLGREERASKGKRNRKCRSLWVTTTRSVLEADCAPDLPRSGNFKYVWLVPIPTDSDRSWQDFQDAGCVPRSVRSAPGRKDVGRIMGSSPKSVVGVEALGCLGVAGR